jgi:hypothetical protein
MSRPVAPVLRLAVLCQSIEEDREGRPFALEVLIHTLRWPQGHTGAYRPPTLELYLQLEDAVGTFNIRCALRRFNEEHEIYRSPQQEVPFDWGDEPPHPARTRAGVERAGVPAAGGV